MYISIFVSTVWCLLCLTGIAAFGLTTRGYYTFYDLYVADSLMASSIIAHFASAISLLMGSYAFQRFYGLQYLSPISVLKNEISLLDRGAVANLTYMMTFICTLSTILTYGFDDIFYRTYYLADSSTLAILSQLSAVVGVLLASFLVTVKQTKSKIAAYFCFLVIFLIVFAKGSRFAVLAILLFQFIPLILNGKDFGFMGFVKIILTILFAYYVMHATLYFRAESEYGLLPYFGSLVDVFLSLSENDFQSFWDILLNISFSLPVTEITIQYGLHDIGELAISLSPLPGEVAGWYEIADARRVSEYIPFSALGELYGYSPLACIIYMFVAGAIFEYAAHEFAYGAGRGKLVLMLLLFSIGVLFCLNAVQYNLRSTTRLLYYLLVIVFSWKIVTNVHLAITKKLVSRR
jgi:hypothetical protein